MRMDEQEQYTTLDIEPKDMCKANMSDEEYIGAMKWNIEKYLWRKKGTDIADMQKLIIYATWLLERYERIENESNKEI